MHILKELAAHSDIRTTQQYYVKVQSEPIKKARKAIELSVCGSVYTIAEELYQILMSSEIIEQMLKTKLFRW